VSAGLTTPPVLETRSLVSGYERDLPIVRGVDLSVRSGEFVVLLGPNGAGKSTLVKTIAGLVPVHSGSVQLEGADITASPPHQKVRHGLAFVPQTENIFATLSIHENLQVAANILEKQRRAERIAALYAMFPDLAARPRFRAGQLSGGQRQMLAVARALVVEPSVLILDEPSAGLSPRIVAEVFERLRGINRAGVTTVLVEQNVKAALAIADRAVILVEGRVAHQGQAAMLADDPIVGELYLGARRTEAAAAR
jgi:branched-chain amino acid transport system ATP-binding protein